MHRRRKHARETRDARLNDLLSRVDPSSYPVPDQAHVPATLDWASFPAGLDPSKGDLDEDRASRKRAQLASMVGHVSSVVEAAGGAMRIVDCGAGSGHLGLMLAQLFPRSHVVLLERKEWSCKTAEERIAAMELTNCEIRCQDIRDFAEEGRRRGGASGAAGAGAAVVTPPFDLCVSLHSCGLLTDLIVTLCVETGASFVLCPCCYGQIGEKRQHPRSQRLAALYTKHEFPHVASGADFVVRKGDWDFAGTDAFRVARSCMRLVDYDRGSWAEETGRYRVWQSCLEPITCSAKNNILAGVHSAHRRPGGGDVAGIQQEEQKGGGGGGGDGGGGGVPPAEETVQIAPPVMATGAMSKDALRQGLHIDYEPAKYPQLLRAKAEEAFEKMLPFFLSADGDDDEASRREGVARQLRNLGGEGGDGGGGGGGAQQLLIAAATSKDRGEDEDEDGKNSVLGGVVETDRQRTVVSVFGSPPSHHRLRCRFAIRPRQQEEEGRAEDGAEEKRWSAATEEEEPAEKVAKDSSPAKKSGGLSSSPSPSSSPRRLSPRLCYAISITATDWIPLTGSFPLASRRICAAMDGLLEELDVDGADGDELRGGLQAVEFLGAFGTSDLLITLVYDRPIGGPIRGGDDGGTNGTSSHDDPSSVGAWRGAATRLRERLCECMPRHLRRWQGGGCSSGGRDDDDEAAGESAPEGGTHSSDDMSKLNILGRSKGVMVAAHRNTIDECVPLPDGRKLWYRQVQGSFSNPNGAVNAQVLGWLSRLADAVVVPALRNQGGGKGGAGGEGRAGGSVATGGLGPDLLELYCGGGNHTVALASKFRRILCVELDKNLCNVCRHNLRTNGVGNVEVRECHSHRFCQHLLRDIGKQVTKDLSAAATTDSTTSDTASSSGSSSGGGSSFGAVLVDPPRAGLDPVTLSLVRAFPFVFYISCNPDALVANLEAGLGQSHVIAQAALFDQFPYTRHTEVGVLLVARDYYEKHML